jgi:hypothetical protein
MLKDCSSPRKTIAPIAILASSYGCGVGVVATLGGMIGSQAFF